MNPIEHLASIIYDNTILAGGEVCQEFEREGESVVIRNGLALQLAAWLADEGYRFDVDAFFDRCIDDAAEVRQC